MSLRLALEAGSFTLEAAVALGVTAVPIDGDALLRDGVDATLAPLRQRGLVPCQVSAFFLNPLDPDPTARTHAVERFSQLIPRVAATGARFIALPGGSLHPDVFGGADPRNLSDAALDAAADVLTPLATRARDHGLVLSLEPHLRSVLATPERAAALCDRVNSPGLRITFDVSNTYDFFDLLDPTAMIARWDAALSGRTGLVHLKEGVLQPGFHLHAGLGPLGTGGTDWSAVLAVAARIAPSDTWLLVEHCADASEATASVALIREAATRVGLQLN